MSDINPSLVSSELTTIETFKDTTEKRGSKLTLNELNYISDKQLHQKTDGGGDGPVGLAKVTFVSDDLDLSLSEVFSAGSTMWGSITDMLLPGRPFLFVSDPNYNVSIEDWNTESEANPPFVAPFVFGVMNPSYSNLVTVSSGNAEIVYVESQEVKVLYVTGDCTISVTRAQ